MKCLVAVKQIIDYRSKVEVKSDHSGIEDAHVNKIINPLDEIALEEAVRWKEAGWIKEVVAISVGSSNVREMLLLALARGADKAILIETAQPVEPITVAQLLQVIVLREHIDCVWLGKQAIDEDSQQTGPMLAGLLGWPQAIALSSASFDIESRTIHVVSEVMCGSEEWVLSLPAVLTVDLPLNEPRTPTLPHILSAKTKPIEVIDVAQLGIPMAARVEYLHYETIDHKRSGIILDSPEALVKYLRKITKGLPS